jgi:two-component system, sensor histidine kinase and response regulator
MNMDTPFLRMLYVEDERDYVRHVTRILERNANFPYRLDAVNSLQGGLDRIKDGGVDMILLNPSISHASGLDALDRVIETAPRVPVIVLADIEKESLASESLERGATDFLIVSRMTSEDLINAMRRARLQRRADDAMIEDRNLLNALLDNATDHIYFKDLDSRFTRINRSMAFAFNLNDPAEAIGLMDRDFFSTEHAEQALKDEKEIIRTGRPLVNKEEKETWEDGHITWVTSTKMPLKDARGKIIGTFGISRDITRRKTAEQELRHAQMFLDSIVENIPNMIFVKNAEDLRFVRFNKAGEELLGYERSELLGKNDYDFFPVQEADFFTSKDREVLRGGKPVDIPSESIKTRHKGNRILHTTKIPLLDTAGKPKFLLGISEDITERVRVEEEKRRAEEAERQVMERTDRLNTISMLAAGMAHEVNNPLQAMLSHLNLVKSRLPESDQGRTNLAMVEQGIESIAALVHKMMTMGGADPHYRGQAALCEEAIDFVRQLTGSQLARAGVDIHVEHHARNDRLAIPEREFIQVLLNLIMNALDAMPDGGLLTIQTETDSDRKHMLIHVKDTGRGIAQEDMGKIFAPFFTTKGVDGTGLGLAVAASLVRDCEGDIRVESKPGHGAHFTLRIPYENRETT